MASKFVANMVVASTRPAALRRVPAEPARSLGPALEVGLLAGFDGDGTPLVEFGSNPFLQAIPARSCIDVKVGDVGSEVVLWFDQGDLSRPLLMGRVRPSSDSHQHEDLEIDAEAILTDALDEDVRLMAARSITLRCGKASITLTRDGRILLHGTYVETHACGTNRIKGGSVRIN